MKQKFECLNCHHQFEGEGSTDVSCPKCGSDNVRPVKSGITGLIIKIAVFVVAIVVGFFVVKAIKESSNGTPTSDTDEPVVVDDPVSQTVDEDITYSPGSETESNPQAIDVQEKKIEEEAKRVKVQQPVTLAISTPIANADGSYSFTAKAEHLPQGVNVVKFYLTNTNDKSVISSSPTGHFTGVPASETKGRYNLCAELSDGTTVSKDGVGGFDKVQNVKEDNRMQPAELTQLINTRDRALGLGKNPKVIRNPKIVITNDSDENNGQVKIIDDIYGRIEFGEWTSINVTEVGYDSQGRINRIVLTVNK